MQQESFGWRGSNWSSCAQLLARQQTNQTQVSAANEQLMPLTFQMAGASATAIDFGRRRRTSCISSIICCQSWLLLSSFLLLIFASFSPIATGVVRAQENSPLLFSDSSSSPSSSSSSSSSSFRSYEVNTEIRGNNAPRFEFTLYNATVTEETTDTEFVIQVTAHDADLSDDEATEFITYTLADASGKFIPSNHLPFRIDRSGIIWTTGRIDREEQPNFLLEVTASDELGFTGTTKVNISIEDKNDNPPRFTRLFSANVSESAPRGTFVIQVTSSDRDTDPANNEATYSLLNFNDQFEIESHTGKIYTTGSLDRESKDEYLLVVSTNDSSWRAQTTVTITIDDENDSPPRFERPVYEFRKSVASNDMRVGSVKATDADAGPNGEVTYQLKDHSDIWALNVMTGEITIKLTAMDEFTRQSMTQHTLIVIASDHGSPPLATQAIVTITVLPDDANLEVYTKDMIIPIPVNLPNDTVIHSLRSPALLLTGPGPILHSIGNKLVYGGEGMARVGGKFVYSVKSILDEFNITLVIVNPNLAAPKFEQKKYQIMVPESRNTSELLAHFSATDEDTDDFNRNVAYQYQIVEVKWNERAIEYYESMIGITINNIRSHSYDQIEEYFKDKPVFNLITDPFTMDADSGALYLKNQLDYELVVSYRLQVIAKDGAWFNRQNTSAFVLIHVTDVNDNRPVFTNLDDISTGMEVYENNLVGHIVGDVRAVDFDSLPNSQITFEIENIFDFQNFSISAKTGQIQALTSFDFEKKSEYTLSVIARNDNQLKSFARLKIRVKDINEYDGRTTDPISFGVIVIVMFFIILFLVISTSFFLFKQKKKELPSPPIYGPPSQLNLTMPRKLPTSNLTLPLSLKDPHSNAYPNSMLTLTSPCNGPTLPVASSRLTSMGPINSQPLPPVSSVHSSIVVPSSATVAMVRNSSHLVNSSVSVPSSAATAATTTASVTSPDVIDGPVTGKPTSVSTSSRLLPGQTGGPNFALSPSSDNYSEILVAAEHYDLENASSIAPSDIDLAYRFKGYHHQHPPPRIPSANGSLHSHHHHHPHPHHHLSHHHMMLSGPHHLDNSKPDHRHVPLARLSPSVSELTAPRILTLQDLSPASVPVSPPNTKLATPSKMRNTAMSRTMSSADSSDEEGVDSFTSSEYGEAYKMDRNDKAMFQPRVW